MTVYDHERHNGRSLVCILLPNSEASGDNVKMVQDKYTLSASARSPDNQVSGSIYMYAPITGVQTLFYDFLFMSCYFRFYRF